MTNPGREREAPGQPDRDARWVARSARRWFRAVCRRPAPVTRTAWPIAVVDPTRTTSFLARVTAVYSRFRCSIIHALVVIGMTTHGYSLPCARCTVTA